jgi:NADPH2:quinone reductase
MSESAIFVEEFGGPEVLTLQDTSASEPGPGQVRIRHEAIGLNFIDTYHRSGLYDVALPFTPGLEAAGIVDAVGPDVSDIEIGQRVVYVAKAPGAYATANVVPAQCVIPVPDRVELKLAAAITLKGLTAQYLVKSTYPVDSGDTVLVHAAAGATGSLLVQWLKHLGAEVIGTVGGSEKVARAKRLGAQKVIDYRTEDFVEAVAEYTDNGGVDVVFDGVGKATLKGSLSCLKPRGTMVSFGNASGAPDPIEPLELMNRGSVYFTRPTLRDYTSTREELLERAADLFAMIESGALDVTVENAYPLEEAARAHSDLAARRTVGPSILIPGGERA